MFVKRRPFLYCLALLILAAEPIQSQQRAEDKPLVLKGATIIDGLGNSPISEGVIVIEQDRIKTVRKGAAYPSDANVVDVSGKFIIPGLVDSHVHYQPWLGEMFLNYGVTSVMIPGGDYSTADREASYRTGARMPRIFATGGRPAIQPGMSRDQVRAAVQDWFRNKKPDYANPSVYNEGNAEVYRWAAEDLHEAGLVWFGRSEERRVGKECRCRWWGGE